MSSSPRFCPRLVAVAILLGLLNSAPAQTLKDKVGYTALLNEYGASLATGAGVRVGLVEADVDAGANFAYFPNTASAEFSGKTFTDLSNQTPTTLSSHSTGVAGYFFGNSSSFSPGVTSIDVYEANHFVDVLQRPGTLLNPDPTMVSVLNHSYIGFGVTPAQAADHNARLDYTVTRDNVTSVVALNNGVGAIPQLYGQAYNSIVVGRSDGLHSFGLTTVNGSGRIKPDIVAPQSATSFATPSVSSAAALLHSAASSSGLTEARNSETMKAILMAGATKAEFPGWSNTSTRPLDTVFGAGELNVYNSYKILMGSDFDGTAAEPTLNSGLRGWDYSDSIASNSSLFWNFEVGSEILEASMVLTWNARFEDLAGNFNNSLTLANLDLHFFDSTSSFLGSEIAVSMSSVDNVEHIYLKNLAAGKYTLEVANLSALNTGFGLAWNIVAVPEPGSLTLAAVALLAITIRIRRPTTV